MIFKVINNYYCSEQDIANLVNYMRKEGSLCNARLLYWCNSENIGKIIAAQIMMNKRITGRESVQRNVVHFVFSFDAWNSKEGKIDKYVASHIANRISIMIFPSRQSFYSVHTDTNNIHIHMMINALDVYGSLLSDERATYNHIQYLLKCIISEISEVHLTFSQQDESFLPLPTQIP